MSVNVWRVPKVVYEITSPRAMRAFMVVAFCLTAIVLVLSGQDVPTFIVAVLGWFGGHYFDRRDDESSSS